jgi:hypothetical protein
MSPLARRLLKLIAGLVLIVIGAGLSVLFTAAINEPRSFGPPMNFSPFAIFTYWPVVFVLDVVFLSLVYGGVKLAGFGLRIFGLILIVAGISILILGIWNHVTGPPLDYDSTLPETNKMHVPFELNLIVYFWAGLTSLGGLLLTVLAHRAIRD